MSAWGTAIFSDDVAADTRDAFTDLVAEGLGPAQATERLVRESSEVLEDEGDAKVFWLALAATQWKLGRLLDPVRERALGIIDRGEDLSRWQESTRSEVNQRKKHLAKLREQLLSPQPAPKKLKPYPKCSTDLQVGDVAVFRLDERTSVRFCVVELGSDRGGTYAEIRLLGFDDGRPFRKREIATADTVGPQYMMLSHEPADRVTVVAKGVAVSKQLQGLLRSSERPRPSPQGIPTDPQEIQQLVARLDARMADRTSCTWDRFPDALQPVLSQLRSKRGQPI